MERLLNQIRFVQMIIKKELVVSGRKKADILSDLKSMGFKPFPKDVKPKAQDGGAETEGSDEQEIEDNSDSSNGYHYLLSVVQNCSPY